MISTIEQPPALASWILVHFTDADEGLIGDLFEEHRRRGSRLWYWRQVAIAIIVGFVRGVLNHKLETVQAVFTAFAALTVGGAFVQEPLLRLLSALVGTRMPLPPWAWNNIFMVTMAIIWFATALATGMLIARLHPARRATMTFAILTFLTAIHLPEWYRLAMSSLEVSRFAPYLLNNVGLYLIAASGISMGCLWNRGAGVRPETLSATSARP